MSTEALVFSRAVVCLAFALSAAGKARDMSAFVHGVRSFRLLPARWSAPTAWAVLAAEVAVVALQLSGTAQATVGLALALGLLTAYTTSLGVLLVRRSDVRCNCFGPATRTVSAIDLVRNVLLAAAAVVGVVAVSAGEPSSLPLADAALVVLPAAALVIVVTGLDDVVAVLRTPPRNDD
ncbi:MauE/DoxX family redox-associated membrane protein [Actinomycetes bacterium KLBMP 9759]